MSLTRMPIAWLYLLAAAALPLAASAETAAQEARYHDLIEELRCLVCQNQTIAESNAPLAKDLRQQVRAQIAAGRSDTEILDYMTDRYGDFVRYRPPLRGYTLLLWSAPGLLLLAGLLALWRFRAARDPDRDDGEAGGAAVHVSADQLRERIDGRAGPQE